MNEGVAHYFTATRYSDEVHIRKPATPIFHHTAHALGVHPTDIVHIGDNLSSDVWGAKQAGYKAIYFTSLEGQDRESEADPRSLVSLSKGLDRTRETVRLDASIASLTMLPRTITVLSHAS